MYMLQLFDKTNAVHPIDARLLREGVLRIGRDAGADWPIADPLREVSRWHCEVEAKGDGLSLRSLGANGVFDDQTGDKLPDGEPVDLALPCTFRLGSFRIAASHAPQADAAVDVARTTVMTPPLGTSLSVPTDWSDAASPRVFTEGSLLEAFCEGAGLDASLLSTEEPTEIMRRAGAVYRQMVLGIGDLMAERERARARYQLTRTTIGGANNNPFKWAPTQRLAIDLLLAGSHNFLSGPSALKASFQDIKRHLVATFAGLQGSLRRAVDSFEPGAIEAAVAPKVSLFKNRGSLHADEVAARHKDLVDQLDEDKNGSLSAAFVAAYDEAERRLGREA